MEKLVEDAQMNRVARLRRSEVLALFDEDSKIKDEQALRISYVEQKEELVPSCPWLAHDLNETA